MTKAVTLRLQETVLNEAEALTRKTKVPRDKYINNAVSFYNLYTKRRLLKERLHKESRLVRRSSMAVLREFERIEDEIL
jgi:hypothetical protein